MSKQTATELIQALNKSGYEVEAVLLVNQKHEPDEDDIDPTSIGTGTGK